MSKPGGDPSSGISSGDAWDGPRGIRHVDGANLNWALVRNVRTWPAMPREKMLWGGGEEIASIVADVNRWSPSMQTPNDLSQSRTILKQDSTLIAVIDEAAS